MTFGEIVLVWMAVAGPILFVILRRFARLSDRRLDASETSEQAEVVFTGGLRWSRRRGFGGGNASTPLARMTLYSWGIRLGPRWAALKCVMPTLDILWAEVTSAQAATGGLGSSGIWLNAPASDVLATFWTSQQDAILDALEAHGVRVDRAVLRLGWMSGEPK